MNAGECRKDFLCIHFSNEQEFCITESLFCDKTLGGDFAEKALVTIPIH